MRLQNLHFIVPTFDWLQIKYEKNGFVTLAWEKIGFTDNKKSRKTFFAPFYSPTWSWKIIHIGKYPTGKFGIGRQKIETNVHAVAARGALGFSGAKSSRIYMIS